MLRRSCLVMPLMLLAHPAYAQDEAATPPAILRDIEGCRAIADGTARLSCFDAAAGRLSDAVSKREVVVLDEAEVKRTRRSLFGFTLPRLPFLRGRDGDKAEEAEFAEIASTVSGVRGLGYGKWELNVDDAVWQTTEPLRFPPRTGAAVRIKRAALGSFFLSVNDARAVRAMRVR